MSAVITILLNVLEEIISNSSFQSSSLISSIIAGLTNLIPELGAAYAAIAPRIKAITAALRSNAVLTTEDFAQLDAIDAAADAAIDAAAKADGLI